MAIEKDAETASKRDRSPAFPFISLKAAIDRLIEFEQKFGRNPPPADRAYLAWGYKGDTSQAQQTMAALKYFGLVEYKGVGKKRLVAITDDARTYLRANQQTIKDAVLKKLALRPAWIARMWNEWGADRHPDEVCLDALVLEHKFNDKSAPTFLRVYDDTIAYAGLVDSDKVDGTEDEDGEEPADSSDDGEGEEDAPPPDKRQRVRMAQGERELTTGLLAKDSSFRLIVTGKIGAKEIDRLIAKLQLDKEILAEPDGDEEGEES